MTLVTDLFRLHKVVVATDGKGNLYGINSQNGDIQYFVSGLEVDATCFLETVRTAAHGHPQMFLSCNQGDTSITKLFNPLNGDVIKSLSFKQRILTGAKFPGARSAEVHPVGLLFEDLRLLLVA